MEAPQPCYLLDSSHRADIAQSLEPGDAAGLLFNPSTEGDHDISIHEVQFDQKELEQFDEEFSDLGDTITDDPELVSIEACKHWMDSGWLTDPLSSFFS